MPWCFDKQIILKEGFCQACKDYTKPSGDRKVCKEPHCDFSKEIMLKDGTCSVCNGKPSNKKECSRQGRDDADSTEVGEPGDADEEKQEERANEIVLIVVISCLVIVLLLLMFACAQKKRSGESYKPEVYKGDLSARRSFGSLGEMMNEDQTLRLDVNGLNNSLDT